LRAKAHGGYFVAMRVLITNDDGIDAPGIAALETAVAMLGWDYTLVAPSTEHSMCGHRITTHSALVLEKRGERRFALAGTPADCVRVALFGMELKPDLVVAGINAGGNLGQDIVISGTVAAAREAAYHGVPSVAMSHYLKRDLAVDWQRTARWAAEILRERALPEKSAGTIINVNFPHPAPDVQAIPEQEWCMPEIAPLGVRYSSRLRDCGATEFHYTAVYNERPRSVGSDVDVCFSGKIALSRLGVDGAHII
jgi:5'-nucleotidase